MLLPFCFRVRFQFTEKKDFAEILFSDPVSIHRDEKKKILLKFCFRIRFQFTEINEKDFAEIFFGSVFNSQT
jgi:hypothetical protein